MVLQLAGPATDQRLLGRGIAPAGPALPLTDRPPAGRAQAARPAGARLPCAMPRSAPRWLVHLVDPAGRYLDRAGRPPSRRRDPRAIREATLVRSLPDARSRFLRRQERAHEVARRHRSQLEAVARQVLETGAGRLATSEGILAARLIRFGRGDHVLEVRASRRRPGSRATTARTRLPRRPAGGSLDALVGQLAWHVSGLAPSAEPVAGGAQDDAS